MKSQISIQVIHLRIGTSTLFTLDSTIEHAVQIRSPLTKGQLFALVLCASVLGSTGTLVDLPTFIQPSLVGGLWGLMYVTGTLLTAKLQRPYLAGPAAIAVTYLNLTTLHRVTDFDWSACLLISATISGMGCFVQRLFNTKASKNSLAQWRLWDLVVLMTIAALCSQAIPNLKQSPLFAIAVALTLMVGLSGCWIAHRWAILDRFAWFELSFSGSLILLAGVLLLRVSPGQGFETLRWLISGPCSVLAAQGITVMACLALTREYEFAERKTNRAEIHCT